MLPVRTKPTRAVTRRAASPVIANSWISNAPVAKLSGGTLRLRLPPRRLLELALQEVVQDRADGHDRREFADLVPARRDRGAHKVRGERELQREREPFPEAEPNRLGVGPPTRHAVEVDATGAHGRLDDGKRDDQTCNDVHHASEMSHPRRDQRFHWQCPPELPILTGRK